MINHLGIIMDWNRRWAKSKFLPSVAWHIAWANNVVKITKLSSKLWIKFLTLWVLSTDNLNKRWDDEVKWIIKLINNIDTYLKQIKDYDIKIETIWNIEKLPEKSYKKLLEVKEKTKNNKWLTVVLALIYWWQDEIVRATKKIIKAWINPDSLSKEEFRKYTDTWKFPIIDMIVRTGWDIRHSWFCLFDSEYSEYYFTEKKWPEFNEDELNNVIKKFNNSKRNFWK